MPAQQSSIVGNDTSIVLLLSVYRDCKLADYGMYCSIHEPRYRILDCLA
jgi:hypothetical protein